MEKGYAIYQTLAAANVYLAQLQSGAINPDINSFIKWHECILRYVFYHDHQRTSAQALQNFIFNKKPSVADVQGYIAELELMKLKLKRSYLESKIEYEPIFERVMKTVAT